MHIVSKLPEYFKILVMSRGHKNTFDSVKFDRYIPIKASTKDLSAFLEWRIDRSNVLKRILTDDGETHAGNWLETHDNLVADFQGK